MKPLIAILAMLMWGCADTAEDNPLRCGDVNSETFRWSDNRLYWGEYGDDTTFNFVVCPHDSGRSYFELWKDCNENYWTLYGKVRDSLRGLFLTSAAPETIYVVDTLAVSYNHLGQPFAATTIPHTCLYNTEYEVCKVRGHDFTHRIGWSDFPNPYYDETYFECKWCGVTIERIIKSPAPDTTYKERGKPSR